MAGLVFASVRNGFCRAGEDFSRTGLRVIFQSQMLESEQTGLVSPVSLPSHPKTDFGMNRRAAASSSLGHI